MDGILNYLYAKKAWVGAIIAAVGQYANLIRQVVADESISFTEAETVINGGIALVVTVGVALGVFKARNESKGGL